MDDLTQQQMALLERYHRAHAAWRMAVNREDEAEIGVAYFDARSACLAAGVDPSDHLRPITKDQALESLQSIAERLELLPLQNHSGDLLNIRRALEALPNV